MTASAPIQIAGRARTRRPSMIDSASMSVCPSDEVGELKGTVRSTYNVVTLCTLGLLGGRFFGKGSINASYDRESASLDGGISFIEPKAANGAWQGGSGTWRGQLDGSVEGPLVEQDDCLGVMFPEDEFLDAGI